MSSKIRPMAGQHHQARGGYVYYPDSSLLNMRDPVADIMKRGKNLPLGAGGAPSSLSDCLCPNIERERFKEAVKEST